jgi:hypothetical protein
VVNNVCEDCASSAKGIVAGSAKQIVAGSAMEEATLLANAMDSSRMDEAEESNSDAENLHVEMVEKQCHGDVYLLVGTTISRVETNQ